MKQRSQIWWSESGSALPCASLRILDCPDGALQDLRWDRSLSFCPIFVVPCGAELTLEALQTQLYNLERWANTLVTHQLDHLSLVSVAVMLGAGLLTSLTPCMLSMLPITLGYMGGYASEAGEDDSHHGRWQAAQQSLWFAAGLATMLTLLGMGAALLGRVYGQVGIGLPIVVSVIAILMGLNLLEIISLRLPGLNLQVPACRSFVRAA